MHFFNKNGTLIAKHAGETLKIEAWGKDSLRIRAWRSPKMPVREWALTEVTGIHTADVQIQQTAHRKDDGTMDTAPEAIIKNGRISARVNFAGVITFYRDNKEILQEYYRNYDGTISRESRCLKLVNREWKGIIGGSEYTLKVKFEADPKEKIYGMGQYQQPYLDLKGEMLELAQRNSQVTIPFYISNKNYGFLWNNPASGQAVFAKNMTEWTARSTDAMDYWITVGDEPKNLLANYTDVTGHSPAFPDDMLGLWQCKLRYRTQEEVLSVAREYVKRGIHIDCIVIDFFHWTRQGDWKFDPKYWPDPKAMCDELHSYGIKVIVSVWPSVDRKSENFEEMMEKGYLIQTERGAAQTYDYQGDCVSFDAFNPEAREYVWKKCKEHYYDLGIDGFWLDNSEPDYGVYDFEHYRYYDGPALSCTNIYPQYYSRTFFDPMEKCIPGNITNLLRSGWAGSQKYGNVLWSGDVPGTWESLQDQVQAGLNMGLSGISWWNTDIGGFLVDDARSEESIELLQRWFEFAVFSPVLRMHGDKGPNNIPPLDDREYGGGYLYTGHSNELWSYGEEAYRTMKKYYDTRIAMKPYLEQIFAEASENGSPLMRTMFYEFPDDEKCWNIEDQYMFGPKYLVAPVFHSKERERTVYLPDGKWKLTSDGSIYEGKQTVTVPAPLDYMPVFEKI